jgi:hypothetical protein
MPPTFVVDRADEALSLRASIQVESERPRLTDALLQRATLGVVDRKSDWSLPACGRVNRSRGAFPNGKTYAALFDTRFAAQMSC